MKIDLNTLAGGAVIERVNQELQKIAENVMDPNTKADATRSLTLAIKIKPDKTREIGSVEITAKSTLSPAEGIPTKFIFDTDKNGKSVVAELVSGEKNQLMITDKGEVADDRGKVINGNFR